MKKGDTAFFDQARAIRERTERFNVPADAPPCNLDAEAALLGAIMIDNRVLETVRELVAPEDFYHPSHRKIFDLILGLVEEGMMASPVTLRPMVERDPLMMEMFKGDGGPAVYLAQLTGNPAALVGGRSFATQIADLARIREIQLEAARAVELMTSGEVPLIQATAGLDAAVGRAVHHAKPTKVLTAAGMVRQVKERSKRITEERLNGVGPQCKTISDLNQLFGPLEDGTLLIAAGRPGMGKTTLAMSAAWGYAANGVPVEYFAAEGSLDTLAMRMVSDISLDSGTAIKHDAIRHDRLTAEERVHLDRLEAELESLPIHFEVIDSDMDIRRLRSKVARRAAALKAKGRKLGIVVVDYLQLLSAYANGKMIDDPQRRVAAISRGLLAIAKEFECVVIALSQLTRAVEQRPDKRPQMSDLRESGQIEQDADVVLLLYREQHYLEHEKPREGTKHYAEEYAAWDERFQRCQNRVDLILGKNRHGEARTRTAKFYGKYYAIRGGDYSPDFEADPLLF